jgi:putative membrane-bound dehydrogenase-like protein
MSTRSSGRRLRATLILPVLLLGPAAAQEAPKAAGLAPEEAARAMTVPPGFRATLFAGEPDVRQPIALAFDDLGRLWVAENYLYPEWKAGKGRDRIVIFEDLDGDGKFDRKTIFVDDLNFVSGIEIGFGGVWVAAPPNLLFYPMKSGGTRPEGPPEVVLDGWGHQDTHNLINNLIWGPDGWLYGCHGIATRSLVGKPGTPDPERTFLDVGIWRYHPTRRRFEVFSEGTCNPWGVDFNDWGQALTAQCVIPHLHLMIQGGRHQRLYGQHPNPYTYRDIQHIGDHLHWVGDKGPHAGNGKSDSVGGGHAHAGAMIYLGGSFPAEYRNRLFANNIHGNRIVTDLLEPQGSGYIGRHGPDFMLAHDSWYRGLNMTYGPDGSVFVIDWYDKTACHFFGPEAYDRTNGRIFKISYGTPAFAPVDLGKLSNADLVRLQLHPNDWYVRHARRLLQERGGDPEVHRALARMVSEEPDASRKLRALWALHVTGGLSTPIALEFLESKEEWVRAWTVQLLGEAGTPAPGVLGRLEDLAQADSSPVVRRYLASLLQRLTVSDRLGIARALASHAEDAEDHNQPLLLWYGVEPIVPAAAKETIEIAAHAKIPLLREFIARRAVQSGAFPAPLAEALRLTQDSDTLAQFLAGLRDGLRGRKDLAPPPGWDELWPGLVENRPPSVQRLAFAVGAALGEPKALEALRRILTDSAEPLTDRSSALETLLQARDSLLPASLLRLLENPDLRGAAIRALGSFDEPRVSDRVLAIYASLGIPEKRDAVNTLAGRLTSAIALRSAVEKGIVPKQDLTAAVIRQMNDHHDPELSAWIAREWGMIRPTPEGRSREIAAMKKAVLMGPKGDPSRGRAVFARTCLQCHTLFGAGGKVGPELTGANRSDLDYLLVNIMDPSAVVGKDYMATLFRTKGGRIITGIVKQEDPNTVTVATENDTLVLAVQDIEARKPSDISMMPEGLLQNLTAEQRQDLIAYLRSPAQVEMAMPPKE